jgi:hypothetical protein
MYHRFVLLRVGDPVMYGVLCHSGTTAQSEPSIFKDIIHTYIHVIVFHSRSTYRGLMSIIEGCKVKHQPQSDR